MAPDDGSESIENAPVEPVGLTYAHKPNLIGAPSIFRLTPAALEWQVGRRSGRLAYDHIRRIRLSYRPVTMQAYRFIAEIWPRSGPKLELASTSWASMVEQKRHDEEYLAFIAELHRHMAEAKADASYESGALPLLYWPGLIVFVGIVVALAVLIVKAISQRSIGGMLFIALFAAVFIWQVGNIFVRNRPGTYRPDALPQGVLPRPALSPRTTSTEHLA